MTCILKAWQVEIYRRSIHRVFGYMLKRAGNGLQLDLAGRRISYALISGLGVSIMHAGGCLPGVCAGFQQKRLR